MPEHLVATLIKEGNLARLHIKADPAPAEGLATYGAYRCDRALGPGSRRLLDTLRQHLAVDLPAKSQL